MGSDTASDTVTRTVKIRRVSSSTVCTVPQSVLDISGLSVDTYVVITGNTDGITIKRADSSRVTLADKWKEANNSRTKP